MFTLLFVDDHPLYREGVRMALREVMPQVRIVLAEGSAAAMSTLATDTDIDLCLSDFHLPDGDGLSLLAQVAKRYPSVARGLLCGTPDASMARQAKSLGAVACLSKDRDIAALAEALGLAVRHPISLRDPVAQAEFAGNGIEEGAESEDIRVFADEQDPAAGIHLLELAEREPKADQGIGARHDQAVRAGGELDFVAASAAPPSHFTPPPCSFSPSASRSCSCAACARS